MSCLHLHNQKQGNKISRFPCMAQCFTQETAMMSERSQKWRWLVKFPPKLWWLNKIARTHGIFFDGWIYVKCIHYTHRSVLNPNHIITAMPKYCKWELWIYSPERSGKTNMFCYYLWLIAIQCVYMWECLYMVVFIGKDGVHHPVVESDLPSEHIESRIWPIPFM